MRILRVGHAEDAEDAEKRNAHPSKLRDLRASA
jgi:hypothetical protein